MKLSKQNNSHETQSSHGIERRFMDRNNDSEKKSCQKTTQLAGKGWSFKKTIF